MKKKLVVLSGAGISAESGLGTFRDSGGLWENFKIEDVATPEAWAKNPELVTEFYNMRRKNCMESEPNVAHKILAELEKDLDVHIITQNIDDLHERAGSGKILHLHGQIMQLKSSGPNQEKEYYDTTEWEVKMGDVCSEGYQLRPHVVWFGEDVPLLHKAAGIVNQADFLLIIGTSLMVYPAAGLSEVAPIGCKKFIIDPNVHELPLNDRFTKYACTATEGALLFKDDIKKAAQN